MIRMYTYLDHYESDLLKEAPDLSVVRTHVGKSLPSNTQ